MLFPSLYIAMNGEQSTPRMSRRLEAAELDGTSKRGLSLKEYENKKNTSQKTGKDSGNVWHT